MRILLVEDNKLFAKSMCSCLGQNRYIVDWEKNGTSAWVTLQSQKFDMVLLDLGLPGLSGTQVLKNMRQKHIDTPVIILTTQNKAVDCIKGLDDGADIFIVKPFSKEELLARIRSIQRRVTSRTEPTITVGDLALNPETRSVFKSGLEIKLIRREFNLLQLLMETKHVLSQKQIARSLYDYSEDTDNNAIEAHICNLRKKCGAETIETFRGSGYKLR